MVMYGFGASLVGSLVSGGVLASTEAAVAAAAKHPVAITLAKKKLIWPLSGINEPPWYFDLQTLALQTGCQCSALNPIGCCWSRKPRLEGGRIPQIA
jgi:hypothetical protein